MKTYEKESEEQVRSINRQAVRSEAAAGDEPPRDVPGRFPGGAMRSIGGAVRLPPVATPSASAASISQTSWVRERTPLITRQSPASEVQTQAEQQGMVKDLLRRLAWQLVWDVAQQLLDNVITPGRGALAASLYREIRAVYTQNDSYRKKLSDLVSVLQRHGQHGPTRGADDPALRGYLRVIAQTLTHITQEWHSLERLARHVGEEDTWLGRLTEGVRGVGHLLQNPALKLLCDEQLLGRLQRGVRPVQTLMDQVKAVWTKPGGAQWQDYLELLVQQEVFLPEHLATWLKAGHQLGRLQGARPYPSQGTVTAQLTWIMEALSDPQILEQAEGILGPEMVNYLKSIVGIGSDALRFPQEGGLASQMLWLFQAFNHLPGVQGTSVGWFIDSLRQVLGADEASRELFDLLMDVSDPKKSLFHKAWRATKSLAFEAVSGLGGPWIQSVAQNVCARVGASLGIPGPVLSVIAQAARSVTRDTKVQDIPALLLGAASSEAHSQLLQYLSQSDQTGATLRLGKVISTHQSFEESIRYLASEVEASDAMTRACQLVMLHGQLVKEIALAVQTGDMRQTEDKLRLVARVLKDVGVGSAYQYLDKVVDLIPLIPALHQARQQVKWSADQSWLEWGEGLVQALERSSQSNKTMQQLREQLMQRLTDWVAQALRGGLDQLGGAVMSRVGAVAAPVPMQMAAPWARGALGPVGTTTSAGEGPQTTDVPRHTRGPGRRLLAVDDSEPVGAEGAMEGAIDASWLNDEVVVDDNAGDSSTNWRTHAQWGSAAWASLGMLATVWSVMRAMRESEGAGGSVAGAEAIPLHAQSQPQGPSPDVENKELLEPERRSPYTDTVRPDEAWSEPSTWQRLRTPIAMATFGVAVPTALLAGLYWTQEEKDETEEESLFAPLSAEELKAIVDDVDSLVQISVARHKRDTRIQPSVSPSSQQSASDFVAHVLQSVSATERSRVRAELARVVHALVQAYSQQHQGAAPTQIRLLVMTDEYLVQEQANMAARKNVHRRARRIALVLSEAVRALLRQKSDEPVVQAYWQKERDEAARQVLRDIQQRYKAAYPMSLDFKAQAKEILARKLKEAGSSMRPDTLVTVDVFESGVINEYDSKPNKKKINSGRYSLIDLAMGGVSKVYGTDCTLELYGLDEQARALFPAGGYVGGGFAITESIQEEIRGKLKDSYLKESTVKAQKEVTEGGIYHAVAEALIKWDSNKEDPRRVAVERFLKGEVSAYSVDFEGKPLKGVFAIPLNTENGRWLGFSVGVGGATHVIKTKEQVDTRSKEASKKWVLPHLDARDYVEYYQKDEAFGPRFTYAPMGASISSSYKFKAISGSAGGNKGWQGKIAERLVQIEYEQIASNLDTAFYTSTEAWLDFVDSDLRLAIMLMSLALGAGAGASALTVGARIAALIGSLTTNLTDFALDSWRASLIENNPQERDALIKWAVAGAVLGVAFDVKDLKTIIKQARGALSKADDIVKLADETFGPVSSVKGGGASDVVKSKIVLPQRSLDELAKRGIMPGEYKGRLYRGDTRKPEDIFNNGFKSQGDDYSLNSHLSFAGGSGFISFTRSKDVSMRYASGRTGEKVSEGYIYKIDRLDYSADIAGSSVKNDPAVKANQEVASIGSVPANQIKGAYKVKFEEGKPPRIDDYYVNKNYRRTKGESGDGVHYHYKEAEEFALLPLEQQPANFEVGYRTLSENKYVHVYTRAKQGQTVGSDTLVVSAHGGYLNSDYGRDLVSLPPETTVKMLTPHDTFLSDPGLDFVVNQPNSYKAYVTLEGDVKEVHFDMGHGNDKAFGDEYDPSAPMNTLGNEEGTNQLLNYRHFQYEGESPQHIANVLIENRRLVGDVPQTDILVMNDLIKSGVEGLAADGTPTASVQTIFDLDKKGLLVNAQGEKYKTIVLSHCRNNLAAPEELTLTYHMKSEVADIVKARGGKTFGVVSKTTLTRGSSGGDLQAKTEVQGVLIERLGKTASNSFPLHAPKVSAQVGVPDRSVLFNAHYKATASSPGTDVCWDYAFDVLKRGKVISSETEQTLRNAAKTLSRGKGSVDTVLQAEKYVEVKTLADLQRVAPGKLVLFMDGEEMKHAVVSLGDGVFSGKKNGILDPKISDGPQIVFAESLVKEHAGKLVGENDRTWTVYAGDAKGAAASHPNVLTDIPTKQEVDLLGRKTEKLLTRDETVLGKDASLTTANGIVHVEFHGAPWISNTYMKVPDVASYIRTRVGSEKWKTVQRVHLGSCFAGLGGGSSVAQVMANELGKPVRATWKKYNGITTGIPNWGRVFQPQANVGRDAAELHELCSRFSKTTVLPLMRAYRNTKKAINHIVPKTQPQPIAGQRTKRSSDAEKTARLSLGDLIDFIFGATNAEQFASRVGLPEAEQIHLETYPTLSTETATSLSDGDLLDYFYAVFLESDELERRFLELVRGAERPVRATSGAVDD